MEVEVTEIILVMIEVMIEAKAVSDTDLMIKIEEDILLLDAIDGLQ